MPLNYEIWGNFLKFEKNRVSQNLISRFVAKIAKLNSAKIFSLICLMMTKDMTRFPLDVTAGRAALTFDPALLFIQKSL